MKTARYITKDASRKKKYIKHIKKIPAHAILIIGAVD